MSDAEKIAELESLCDSYRHLLLKIPHSRGDHSDRCRMESGGEAPMDMENCHCHVGLVRSMLKAGNRKSEK
jgi:hypothetical protein